MNIFIVRYYHITIISLPQRNTSPKWGLGQCLKYRAVCQGWIFNGCFFLSECLWQCLCDFSSVQRCTCAPYTVCGREGGGEAVSLSNDGDGLVGSVHKKDFLIANTTYFLVLLKWKKKKKLGWERKAVMRIDEKPHAKGQKGHTWEMSITASQLRGRAEVRSLKPNRVEMIPFWSILRIMVPSTKKITPYLSTVMPADKTKFPQCHLRYVS